MSQQAVKPEVKKLIVAKDPLSGTRTLKREGGGPLFDLTSEEWEQIKAGFYK